MKQAHQAVQAMGGAGFLADAPVARMFRDAKLMEIGAGHHRDPADAGRTRIDGDDGMKRFACVIALAGIWSSGAVQAQDLIFDMRYTLACLDEAVGAGEQSACVGASANACMSATDLGGTHCRDGGLSGL